MRDLSGWLPDLEPPPGGLARLRRGIVSAPTRAYWPASAIGACCVLLALMVVPAALEHHRTRTELETALRQAVQPPVPGSLHVSDGAAMAIESGQSGLRLYLVQSARQAATTPAR